MTTQIRNVFEANGKVYACRGATPSLAEAKVHVGSKRVARLMRKAGMMSCHRRKKRLVTTKQNPAAAPAPDQVDRPLSATVPN